MFVTGHDTVYRWHCSGGKAVTEGIVETVDARGFLSRLTAWKDGLVEVAVATDSFPS